MKIVNTADERQEGHNNSIRFSVEDPTPSIHPSSALSNRPTPLAKFAANKMVRDDAKRTEKGAAIYSRPFLAIYDFWALGTISTYAWRCKVTKNLIPFFQQNVGKELLDIGVGTGYYLSHANLAPDVSVTLVDLNRNSLDAAKARLGREGTECYVHDITKPLPMTTRFDSMSMFYLLHCMPGPVDSKTAIFANLKNHLTPDGVVFGATILGQGVRHNLLGRTVMYVFNKKGVFDNRGDSEAAIVDALREHFEIVDARIVGTILIFRGQKPKLE